MFTLHIISKYMIVHNTLYLKIHDAVFRIVLYMSEQTLHETERGVAAAPTHGIELEELN